MSATSANLGPGFDCLGLALDWREQVDLTVLPSRLRDRGVRRGRGPDPPGREPLDHPLGAGRAGRPRRVRARAAAARATTPSRTAGASGPPRRRSWPAWSRRPAGRASSWTGPGCCGTPTPSRATRTTWRRRRTVGWSWRTRARTGSRPSPGRLHPEIGAAVLIPDGSVETARARGLLPETGAPRRRRRERRPGRPAGARAGRGPGPAGATPPGTGCTSTTGSRPCRGPTRWSPRCAPPGFAAVISGAGPSVLVLGRTHPARRPGGVPDARLRATALRHRDRRDSRKCRPLREYRPGVLAFYCRTRSADRGGRLVREITSPSPPLT